MKIHDKSAEESIEMEVRTMYGGVCFLTEINLDQNVSDSKAYIFLDKKNIAKLIKHLKKIEEKL